MFKITGNKGFQITFENGNTISVQFGRGNYCSNYNVLNTADAECENAEVAIWNDAGVWYTFDDTSRVKWHCTPDIVAGLIQKAKNGELDF